MEIFKAAGIIIQNRRLLVTKSYGKDIYVSPGGKLEPGEDNISALIRELAEELNIVVSPEDLKVFGKFSAPAAGHEENLVHMTVFTVLNWTGEITPGREVEAVCWVTSQPPIGLQVGSIFAHEVIPQLVRMQLID